MVILSLITATIGLLISFHNYMETRKRNIIDIMPFFDVDINNIFINSDKIANRIQFFIPMINLGNRLALDIKTTESNENIKIIYNLAMEKGTTYITFSEYFNDIIEKEKNFIIAITFKDLSNQIYSQKIELKLKISNNYSNSGLYLPSDKISYFNNGQFYPLYTIIPAEEVIHLYYIDKKVEKPENKK